MVASALSIVMFLACAIYGILEFMQALADGTAYIGQLSRSEYDETDDQYQ
jgi:hypothetical protein